MPQSIYIFALEEPIVPSFLSLSVLRIIRPAALIHGPISSNKLTQTRALIILPLADVVAAIRVHHAPMTVMLIVDPVPIIMLAVCPDLVSFAVPA